MTEDNWYEFQYHCIHLEYAHPSGGEYCSMKPKENKYNSGRIQEQCEACSYDSCPVLGNKILFSE